MVGYNSTISTITRCCRRLTTSSTLSSQSLSSLTTSHYLNNNKYYHTLSNNSSLSSYNRISSSKSTSSTTTTLLLRYYSRDNFNNALESSSLYDREKVNVNFIEPENVKPFKPRLAPYHTQATLDFLITPGQRQFSRDEIDKFVNLAKALSSIGYEHQTEGRYKEAMESYNKALLNVRNVIGQDRNRISLREYAVLMINMAETHSRMDNVDDAILRSKQAIDLLEIDWRNQYDMEQEKQKQQEELEQQALKSGKKLNNKRSIGNTLTSQTTSTVRKSWVKDELLGVAYQNHAEYLVYKQRYPESEPFIRVAHGILTKLYPLDHPVNVDNGMMLIQVLNENARHEEVKKVNDKYGSILMDSMGKENEKNETAIYEQMNEGMMTSLENSIREKYPGVLEEHEQEAERLAQEIANEKGTSKELQALKELAELQELEEQEDEYLDEEEEELERNQFAEPQFHQDDLQALEEEVYSLSSKQKYGETLSTASKLEQELIDDGTIEDSELSKYAEDEEAEEEAHDEFMREISQEEQELGKKYQSHLDKPLVSPEELKYPSDFVLNKLDALLSKGVEEYSAFERAKMIDRDRRIKNKASDVIDQVFSEDGHITTPTTDSGEPISQSNLQKIGQYHAEELIQPDMEEEKELMESYMSKILKLTENIDAQEMSDIEDKFKDIEPLLAQFAKADDQQAKKLFNFSFQDVEQEEEQDRQERERERETEKKQEKKKSKSKSSQFESADLSGLRDNEKDFVQKNQDLMRDLMGQVEKHGFNLEEITKNINLDDYKDLDLGEEGGDFESMLKGMEMDGDDDDFDSEIFKEFDFKGLEDDDEDLDIDNDDENENLDLYIKQTMQDQDLDEFFKNRNK
ncbi:hypothetical protein DFA_08971 [Cavenderia fasciculata]|uniref:Tetratricopeptide-like helical domain-containing protein n=1 Tax=Cavenderia fasciculata TaxID=261658 RepID=F4Q6C3_CACFS|nr:uncharacterized protein DFA_08971 [Cavenderia fasciculata]EGG16433.1 hypothetical protein DFA_08971 [Cavenderia fasciculata]|eukprot:XP_004354833.1 hypothetical protein DFA_08971 [Cavenderia fasciculata]